MKPRNLRRWFVEMVALGALIPGGLVGQEASDHNHHTEDHQNAAVTGSMSGALSAGSHLRMTDRRPASAADSARAEALVSELRRALAKYADPAAAEADGFALFAPNLKHQKVYHYTKYANGLFAVFGFDPVKPTSILYREDESGRKVLVGAMYTMPQRASEEDLDKRVPLSIAQWHLHVNICIPKKGEEQRWLEKKNGQTLFGPEGTVATKEGCDAERGRFFATLFGWMVHANVFAERPADRWGEHHAH